MSRGTHSVHAPVPLLSPVQFFAFAAPWPGEPACRAALWLSYYGHAATVKGVRGMVHACVAMSSSFRLRSLRSSC